MLKINCLLKNTVAVGHIKDAIQILVGERLDAGSGVSFPEIFNVLKKEGLEIDAASAGKIYSTLYGAQDDGALSSTEEVEEFAGRDFQKQLNSVVDDILGETAAPKIEKIGNNSPEVHAVNTISSLFQKVIFGGTEKQKTVMKQMQDFVTQAASSLMDKAEVKKVGLTESLNSFFGLEKNEFKTLNGQANTLETLYKAVQKEVNNYVDQVALKLDDEEAGIFREQWQNYTQAFMDSSYDLVLNKANQNNLVNNALKQIEVDGINIVDVNNNVKWSALIEHNNPDTIADKVKELFKTGFKEEGGNVVKYSDTEAERIGDYFKRIYEQKLSDAKSRALNNNRVRNKSAKNIVSDFIKDRGFFNLVKNKDGKLLLTQTDWDGVMKFLKQNIDRNDIGKTKAGEEIRGLDLVKVQLRKFLSIKNEDGTKRYDLTPKQIQMIEDEFVNTALAKLTPGTGEVTSVERLMALDDINVSNAFDAETQQGINKVVGVSNISQNVLDRLQVLTQLARTVLNGSLVTNSTDPNPDVNRGAYNFTALVEIDRRIKEILREFKIDSSGQQRVVKYLSDILGGGTISLLLNPNNMTENVFTQTATNIGESVNLMTVNPKLFFKTFGTLMTDYWSQFANYAIGGASNELANESDLNSDLQSSERLRIQGIVNEVKGKDTKGVLKGLVSIAIKSPAYVVSIFSRMSMNSFDAATTTSLMRKKMLITTYDALKSQGKTSEEVLKLMDQIYNIPPHIETLIENENKRVEGILKDAGFPVNSVMMNQNKRDLRLSMYEDVIRNEGTRQGINLKQATEITKAIIESSQAQSKSLGGKRQLPTKDVLSVWLYKAANAVTAPQKSLFERVRKAEQKGELNKAARIQFAASLYQNFIGKFVGGVANFFNLALSATPVGVFLQAPDLLRQRTEYLKDHPNAHNVFTAEPEEIKKYNELSGLARSIFTRSIIGSTAMAAFILHALANNNGEGDDDEDNFIANLMKTKTGRRFIQKHLPFGIAMLAPAFYKEGEKDNAINQVLSMFQVYTGKDFDAYTNLAKGMDYAKTDDDRDIVLAKFFGGLVTTYNVNQAEQFIKFKDAIGSAFNKDKIYDVKENEKISKEIYKSVEDMTDAFWLNGIVDALTREDFNRFDNK